jgi:hypothetical protein
MHWLSTHKKPEAQGAPVDPQLSEDDPMLTQTLPAQKDDAGHGAPVLPQLPSLLEGSSTGMQPPLRQMRPAAQARPSTQEPRGCTHEPETQF